MFKVHNENRTSGKERLHFEENGATSGSVTETSVWKTNSEFVAVIQKAFENSRNNTPLMSFFFTYEEIQKMKEFIRLNGIGNTESEDGLQRFYDEFMVPNTTE